MFLKIVTPITKILFQPESLEHNSKSRGFNADNDDGGLFVGPMWAAFVSKESSL